MAFSPSGTHANTSQSRSVLIRGWVVCGGGGGGGGGEGLHTQDAGLERSRLHFSSRGEKGEIKEEGRSDAERRRRGGEGGHRGGGGGCSKRDLCL